MPASFSQMVEEKATLVSMCVCMCVSAHVRARCDNMVSAGNLGNYQYLEHLSA